MKVSIITVCFNSERTIARAVNSVQSQSYSNVEHIIIDGNSSDNTLAIVNELATSGTRVVSEPDNGIYDAMAKGVELASGDIVGILNSDDFYADDRCIEDIVEAFLRNGDVSMIFGDVVFVGADSSSITRYYSSVNFRPWKLRFGWMPPHPATFVREEVYRLCGNYKQDYRISADYERFVHWLMIKKLTYERLDRVIVVMQEGGVSTQDLANRILLNREIVKACRTNGVYTNLFLLLFKFPFKLLELYRRPSRNNSVKVLSGDVRP